MSEFVSALGASLLTALAISLQRSFGTNRAHDRMARNIRDDLRRWVQDRDRAADDRINEIAQQARTQGVDRGGGMDLARGKVYRIVTHEYRDRALGALNDFDELENQEGWLNAVLRKIDKSPLDRPRLPEDCRSMVAKWRKYAEDDLSRPALEPRLIELEQAD